MKYNKILKLVYAALFSALIFIGTQFIQIPLPFGYFNFGDCFIILSAIILGLSYSISATAIGAVLADLISGYAVYIPATLIIKSAMVISVIATIKFVNGKSKKTKFLLFIAGATLAELITVFGYFIYDSIIYGFSGAVISIAGNILQGFVAVIASTLIIKVFEHSGFLKIIKL